MKKLLTMTTEEKKLRGIIQRMLAETNNVSENEMMVRAGVNWDEVKPEFLEKINDLVSKIDDDKYEDAEDLIGKVTNMLKVWKAKIHKGKKAEMVDKASYSETLDEELNESGELARALGIPVIGAVSALAIASFFAPKQIEVTDKQGNKIEVKIGDSLVGKITAMEDFNTSHHEHKLTITAISDNGNTIKATGNYDVLSKKYKVGDILRTKIRGEAYEHPAWKAK